jgi:DNA polymerase elongation subunit (family B)
MNKPRIVVLDIETCPILAHVWGLWDQNVGLSMIERDFSILSFSYKVAGEDKIYYSDVSKKTNINDDKQLLGKIWKVLNKADIVVWHNGHKFDRKKINARLLLNGFGPPSSYISFDTLSEIS